MASPFPAALPSESTMSAGQTLQAAGHTQHHNQVQDDVLAIATRVGVTSSSDNTSHEWKISDLYSRIGSLAPSLLATAGASVNIGSSPAPTGPGLTLVTTDATHATWQPAGGGLVQGEIPSGTINGTNAVFTTASAYTGNTLQVWINGLLQKRGVDYTETTSTTFMLIPAPPTGKILQVAYQTSPFNAAGLNASTIGGKTLAEIIPVGVVQMYGSNVAPTGWLNCDGGAYNRTTYASLFAVIGTAYGVGDGSTTFNVPNLKGMVPAGLDLSQTEFNALGKTGGEKAHTLLTTELPSHTHNHNFDNTGGWAVSNPISATNGATGHVGGIWSDRSGASISGLVLAAGGGAAHNVLQPYNTINFIIKAT